MIVAVILSLLIGASLGLLGGGGSILTVPILRYVLGMEAHPAIALSLLVVGTTSAAAVIPHAWRGNVNWRVGAIFGLAGMAGAYAAGRLAKYIPSIVLLIGFGTMMLITAVAMLRPKRARDAHQELPASDSGPQAFPLLKIVADGLFVGAITGLVGAGGGFLVVPALVLLGGVPIQIAIGTSLLVISMKSLAGFAGFLGHTRIDWNVGFAISIAAILGSIVGVLLSAKLSGKALRAAFGWFLVAMALFVLVQELPVALGHQSSTLVAVLVSLGGTFVAFFVLKNIMSVPGTGRVTEVGGKAS